MKQSCNANLLLINIQLNILGEKNSIHTLPIVKDQLPLDIVKRALNAASLSGVDSIIFDTAGRTQIDLSMMNEIKEIKSLANPIETILVADSLTGQVAAEVAKEFKELFGDDFYLELQRNDLPEQEKVNAELLQIGNDLGIKCVANSIFFRSSSPTVSMSSFIFS